MKENRKEIELFEKWLDEKSEESDKEKILSYKVVSFYDNQMVSEDYENSILKFIELGKMDFNEKLAELTSYREEKRYEWTDFFYENYSKIIRNVCDFPFSTERLADEVKKYCSWNRIRLIQTLTDLEYSAASITTDDIVNPKNKHTEYSFAWRKKDMGACAALLMAIAISNVYEKFKEETQGEK